MPDNIFKRPNWIFFDLDDTIWDFKNNSIKSLRKLYESSPILKKYFKSFEELDKEYHVHNSLLWNALAAGQISSTDLKTERWRRTLQSKTFEVLTAVCEELDTNYLDILSSMPKVTEGTTEILKRLSQKYLIGVLSNGFPATQYKKLKSSGLQKYITRMIVSEEIGKAKPNKDLFQYAISETGAVPPYLMVGDNLEADVIGALQAGWYSIWMTSSDNEMPDMMKLSAERNFNPQLFLGKVKGMKEAESVINIFFNPKK